MSNPIEHSGKNEIYDTGAIRDYKKGKGRMDLLPFDALIRLSKHFEHGAEHYGEHNWQKGIPMHQYIDSALRHIAMYMEGHTNEDHLCAASWNLLCAMWTEENLPEMQDIRTRTQETDGAKPQKTQGI